MARSRRTSASRTLLAFVVASVAVGSAFQFQRTKNAAAGAKPELALAPVPLLAAVAPVSPVAARAIDSHAAIIPVASSASAAFIGGATTRPAPAGSLSSVADAAPTVVHREIVSSVVAPTISPHPLIDARAKSDSGDLLTARKTLNDALEAGNLSAADTASVKKQIVDLNQTLIFGPRHFADDSFGGNYTVKPGQKLGSIANENSVTWEFLLRLNNMSDPKKLRSGQSLKIVKGPFHVVVSKSKFTMDVYLGSPAGAGSMYITTYSVGLGRDDSTPTGTWLIEPHHKIKHPTYYSPRGEGVIAADDPKNPLGPFWLGLTGTDGHAVGKASYGIHGTIEPESIGKMASMGCIRMRNEDVALVYELLVEGKSTVVVKD